MAERLLEKAGTGDKKKKKGKGKKAEGEGENAGEEGDEDGGKFHRTHRSWFCDTSKDGACITGGH